MVFILYILSCSRFNGWIWISGLFCSEITLSPQNTIWRRHYPIVKYIYLPISNYRIRKSPLPTYIQFHGAENEINSTTLDKSIQVFIIDWKNVKKSIANFNLLFAKRSLQNKDFWLLESTNYMNNFPEKDQAEQILHDFKDVPIDLDDDLYVFSGKKE